MLLASLFYLWRHVQTAKVSLLPVLRTLSHQESHHKFDYVIIGGGPGGLTLANRLTEDPSISLALVEAGTFNEDVVQNESTIPFHSPQIWILD